MFTAIKPLSILVLLASVSKCNPSNPGSEFDGNAKIKATLHVITQSIFIFSDMHVNILKFYYPINNKSSFIHHSFNIRN